jgi:hypothetical protein
MNLISPVHCTCPTHLILLDLITLIPKPPVHTLIASTGDAILTLWSTKFIKTIFTNSVPTSKKTQHVSITKVTCLTLFNEVNVVYSENNMKPINILCGQNTELLNVKVGDTYSYHWALQSWLGSLYLIWSVARIKSGTRFEQQITFISFQKWSYLWNTVQSRGWARSCSWLEAEQTHS